MVVKFDRHNAVGSQDRRRETRNMSAAMVCLYHSLYVQISALGRFVWWFYTVLDIENAEQFVGATTTPATQVKPSVSCLQWT